MEDIASDEILVKRNNVILSSTYPANAAQMTAIVTPTPIATTTLGNLGHSPATQYLSVATQALPTLASDMLLTQMNSELTVDFAMYNGSGTVSVRFWFFPDLSTFVSILS